MAKGRKFLGVYRSPDRPNQRLPVHLVKGKTVDIFDRPIDIGGLVKVIFCANCETTQISEAEAENNAGYCNECAFEAWGEGEPT